MSEEHKTGISEEEAAEESKKYSRKVSEDDVADMVCKEDKMKGFFYWAHRANGTNVPPPMTSYNFEQKKWEMHDTFLRVIC